MSQLRAQVSLSDVALWISSNFCTHLSGWSRLLSLTMLIVLVLLCPLGRESHDYRGQLLGPWSWRCSSKSKTRSMGRLGLLWSPTKGMLSLLGKTSLIYADCWETSLLLSGRAVCLLSTLPQGETKLISHSAETCAHGSILKLDEADCMFSEQTNIYHKNLCAKMPFSSRVWTVTARYNQVNMWHKH